MIRNLQDSRLFRFAICGALATALVAGTGSGHFTVAYAKGERAAKVDGKLERSVAKAEQAVRRDPRNAALRAALGNAYLSTGRFASAAATFQDAAALGDGSASTALRLALSHVGTGNNPQAVAVLDQNREAIPAGDLGLALALAGETSRGVEVLTDALRGGENTPKLRQNLAYAYALDGRWAEARVMASQDIPADQIGDRISSWAMKARPEDFQLRVASLLGAPLRGDVGRPADLALADWPAATPAQPQFAAAEAPVGELPSVDPQTSDPSREFAVADEVAPAAVPVAVSESPVTNNFAAAFPEAPQAVVQPTTFRAPVAKAPAKRAAAALLRTGNHSVQLGSFSSPENARRAITILRGRYQELKGIELTVTPAVVRGKNFWRVAANGFSQGSAFGMCSTVRTRGGGCIAYSMQRPLPGALPGRAQAGPMKARR